jgi:hypothetical protein
MYLGKTEFEGVDCLILIQDRVETSLNIQLDVIKAINFWTK